MSDKILAVNAGSSSLKFKMFLMPEEEELFSGAADRIGGPGAGEFSYKPTGGEKVKLELDMPDHSVAVDKLLEVLVSSGAIASLDEIKAVGHRVVQGGEYFKESVPATEAHIAVVEQLAPLAPLHNPANILGVRSFQKALPEASQSLIFDTVFHQTMPEINYIFPIDRKYYTENKVRRYGAHGTSHDYVSGESARLLGKDRNSSNVIVAHLGNGASITEIVDGKSVDTSMGFTPTGGLVMGTRSGDMDPTVVTYLQKVENADGDKLSDIVTKKSGLLALSGFSNDMRDVEEAANDANHEHHAESRVAWDLFVKKVANFITLYAADIIAQGKKVDAIAFTAGIGENSTTVRKAVIDRLACLGVKINNQANETRGTVDITGEGSTSKVYVIPTEEELMISRDAYKILKNS
ncbi:MAG: acetate kinase [Candidatus Ancillula sp.]|jgi:acetate kinase|nr:acetate kinase [Candidatus Ancillula sp.]